MTQRRRQEAFLVTGGAGFLGTHLVRALLREPLFQDTEIVVLDDLSGGSCDNIPPDPRVTFVQGSVTDPSCVDAIFAERRIRFVYHLAAYAAEGLSHFIRVFNYTNNLIGSMHLINAAVRHKAECFVFTSSIAVYGSGHNPLHEALTPQPEDPYGIAKYAVELDLKAAHDLFGLEYVIFRPHNVYGEYQNIGDRYRNVVGIFMTQLLSGNPMPIFGDGEQIRAFTYVGDIAPAMARAPVVPQARNKIFNIGSDAACTVNELAGRVAETLGLPANVTHLPPRQEVRVAFCDHEKFRRVFDDVPQTPLEDGLARMAEWVRQVGIRESPRFSEIELKAQLPPAWRVEESD